MFSCEVDTKAEVKSGKLLMSELFIFLMVMRVKYSGHT